MLYAILGGNSHILTELPGQNQSLRVSRGVDANLNARQLLFAIGGKPNGGGSHIGLSLSLKASLNIGCNLRFIRFQWSASRAPFIPDTASPAYLERKSGRFRVTLILFKVFAFCCLLGSCRAQIKYALHLPEDLLVSTRHNLQLLRDLLWGDPFLFQAPPGEHRSGGPQDDVWKVRTPSRTEGQLTTG